MSLENHGQDGRTAKRGVRSMRFPILLIATIALFAAHVLAEEKETLYLDPIEVHPKPIRQDPGVRYNYDIAYVRAHRAGDTTHQEFYTEIARPVYMRPGADLMLLHPDGSEEVLVSGGEKGAVQDPIISFDGRWVYYALFHDLSRGGQFEIPPGGADLYKSNLKFSVVPATAQGR
jgi:hypothetical protein